MPAAAACFFLPQESYPSVNWWFSAVEKMTSPLFSSQDARRPILNFLRKGRADLREKFRFHRTENELSHRGKRGPLRGVSAEMTDLELMQISVPFHMEGSPHGVGCHNQRLPTAAGHRIEWSAAVPALTKESHKVSKTGGFMKRIIRFPLCTFTAIRTLV